MEVSSSNLKYSVAALTRLFETFWSCWRTIMHNHTVNMLNIALLENWRHICQIVYFVELCYHAQHIFGDFNTVIVIGLTCSWSWNIGPTISSLIAAGRREGSWACQPLYSFLTSSRSIFSLSHTLPSFIDDQTASSSCCGRLWMLWMWLNETQWFFCHYKSIAFCPVRDLATKNWGILSLEMGESDFASLHLVVLFWNSLRYGAWWYSVFLTSEL